MSEQVLEQVFCPCGGFVKTKAHADWKSMTQDRFTRYIDYCSECTPVQYYRVQLDLTGYVDSLREELRIWNQSHTEVFVYSNQHGGVVLESKALESILYVIAEYWAYDQQDWEFLTSLIQTIQ